MWKLITILIFEIEFNPHMLVMHKIFIVILGVSLDWFSVATCFISKVFAPRYPTSIIIAPVTVFQIFSFNASAMPFILNKLTAFRKASPSSGLDTAHQVHCN